MLRQRLGEGRGERLAGYFRNILIVSALATLPIAWVSMSGCMQQAKSANVRPAYLPPEPLEKPLLEIAALEDQRAPVGEAILKYASDSSPLIRARVARALGRLRSSASVPILETLAGDVDPTVRERAYFALGQMSDFGGTTVPSDRAAQILISRYEMERIPHLKATIVEGLGKIGSESSRDVVMAGLKNESYEVQGKAAVAVGIQAYRKLAYQGDVEIIGRLTELLESPDPDVRWKSAYAFVRLPTMAREQNAVVCASLERALSDPDMMAKIFAARALGENGCISSAVALVESFDAEDWRLRVNCLRALGKLGGKMAQDLIGRGLSDPHFLVKQQAIMSLGGFREPDAALLLDPFLNDPSVDPALGAAAVTALRQIGGLDAFDGIVYHLKSEHPWIRMAASTALGELGEPSALDPLISMAGKEDDPRVMVVLAEALGANPGERTDDALLTLLERGDAAVVTVTAKLVAAHKIQKALPRLISAFARQSPVRDWEPREAIVRAIGEIGLRDDLARDILKEAATDTDVRVSVAAVESYRKLFHQELTPIVTPVRPITDDYFEVRRYQRAIIETEKGSIVLALFPEEAPLTVANFVRLARQGYFSGLTFHRVVPNFVAQSGCPRGDGWGGPGYTIRCEINSLPFETGTVGMALSGPDTGGSQFFISHSPEPHLDGTYTVFGKVLDGLDVLGQLKRGDIIHVVRVPEEEDLRANWN